MRVISGITKRLNNAGFVELYQLFFNSWNDNFFWWFLTCRA